jgi:hypothetical protein
MLQTWMQETQSPMQRRTSPQTLGRAACLRRQRYEHCYSQLATAGEKSTEAHCPERVLPVLVLALALALALGLVTRATPLQPPATLRRGCTLQTKTTTTTTTTATRSVG